MVIDGDLMVIDSDFMVIDGDFMVINGDSSRIVCIQWRSGGLRRFMVIFFGDPQYSLPNPTTINNGQSIRRRSFSN